MSDTCSAFSPEDQPTALQTADAPAPSQPPELNDLIANCDEIWQKRGAAHRRWAFTQRDSLQAASILGCSHAVQVSGVEAKR